MDDRTVLVAQIREADADNPLSRADRAILLENERQLRAATGADGRPLRVLEMPVPDIDLFVEEWVVAPWMDDAFPGVFRHYREGEKILWTPAVGYMNFIIANRAILLPAYWNEGLPESVRVDDERARAILADAFPGRTIIQIDPLAINWLGGGMHCTTQQQPRVAR